MMPGYHWNNQHCGCLLTFSLAGWWIITACFALTVVQNLIGMYDVGRNICLDSKSCRRISLIRLFDIDDDEVTESE